MQVTVANDGQQAVEAVKKQTFDVVLMDIQMPVMDGYEATQAIRALPDYKALPIIAMTAHAMAGDREKCLDKGMDDHVPKPTEPNVLYAALLRWIKSSPSSQWRDEEEVVQPLTTTDYGDLSRLPGIDLDVGLRRVAGNDQLLRKLLLAFRHDYLDGVQRFEAMIQQNRLEDARRLAHTIKGTAGNLGAEALSKAAHALESDLKKQPDALPEKRIKDFTTAMTTVLDGIIVLDVQEPEAVLENVLQKIDFEKLIPLLDELEALLNQGNSKAAMMLERITPLVGGEWVELMSSLEEQIDNYEFEEALETLQAIKGGIP
ncbi:response regulator [Magnetococcales bacterium HHB-1]